MQNLRNYLIAGGFLRVLMIIMVSIEFIRREDEKKFFPESDFVELPFSHPIYHQKFSFPKGLPKIHEHDGKPPPGIWYFLSGTSGLFFILMKPILAMDWEDPDVHNDPVEKHIEALKMGANIISFVFAQ